MAKADENKLLESLIWSQKEFSLATFIKTYELPQVVCVEVGYFGESERTTLSSGQILTLHALRKTRKVLCDVPHETAVLLPLNCPLKVEVHPKPKDCKHSMISPEQLATLYNRIRYVRVLAGHYNDECAEESCDIDDILEIKHIDEGKRVIKCKNVATEQKLGIPFDSPALFIPLLDHKQYTLAEVKQKFGFPTKVRFLESTSEKGSHAKSKNQDTTMLVSSLNEITLIEEIEHTDVIATTVMGNLQNKVCLQIPQDLDIQIVAAEGFMSGDATYQRVVRTLDRGFNRTNLKDFDNLDVYEHLSAVKKSVQDMSTDELIERASDDINRRVLEHRSSEFKDQPTPSLPPRPGSSTVTQASDVVPPKPGPKPTPKSKTSKTASKVSEKIKSLSLPSKTPDWLNSIIPNRGGKRVSSSDDTARPSTIPRTRSDEDDFGYVEPIKPQMLDHHAVVKEHDCNGYSLIDPNYVSCDDHLYELPDLTKAGRPAKPDIPRPEVPCSTACAETPPETSPTETARTDKEAIYQEIARIPTDLSGLSVADVSDLLNKLGMNCYIKLFEEELVDGAMLASMDKECLESLNVNAFHATKLMKFINGWRPKGTLLR